MQPQIIQSTDSRFPAVFRRCLGADTPRTLQAVGNLDILRGKKIAVFCSVKCPGSLILKTYDLMQDLREAGSTVISGFHSPMEKECFSLLLRGKQPVIWCPARRLTPRSRLREYDKPLAEGRLLILPPFGETVQRATQDTALFRNEVVAALAERVFVAHAAPGSKTDAFCRKLLEWRKPLFTFDAPDNAALIHAGARPLAAARPCNLWGE